MRPAAAIPVAAVVRRLLRGIARSASFRIMVAAVSVAVAAVTAVGLFTDRFERAMERRGSELLGADLVVSDRQPLAPAWFERAADLGLATSGYVQFPSVLVGAGGDTLLVAVKAIREGYPLRGTLRISGLPYQPGTTPNGIVAAGAMWVDPRVAAQLRTGIGERLELGRLELRIAGYVAAEPDRGADFVQLAPRVMIRHDQLADSGLLGPASRASYVLLAAGEPHAVQAFRDWLGPRLGAGAAIEGLEDARPELRGALDRAGGYLALAALVAVLVAGAAVAMASWRQVRAEADAVAVLRTLGASRGSVLAGFVLQLGIAALCAVAAGSVLGWLGQEALAALVRRWIEVPLPAPSPAPFLDALLVAVVATAGFGVPPALALRQMPVMRVLREDLGLPPVSGWLTLAAAGAAMAGLILWQSSSVLLAGTVIGGSAALLLAMALVAAVVVRLAQGVERWPSLGWRMAVAGLRRSPDRTVIQLMAVSLGLMALLLLAMVRADLLEAWRLSIPEDAPNRFLVNIQPAQVDELRGRLEQAGVGGARLYPMIRGRLVAVNGVATGPGSYREPRAQRLVAREFNLSWAERLPAHNEVESGAWWSPAQAAEPLLSVEAGIAETLDLAVGDRLTFDIGGESVDGRVANLRAVQWESFQVNFFVIGTPAMFSGRPATYITSFHLPAAQRQLVGGLVRDFPGITVFDVDILLDQVESFVGQASQAVEFVFAFTVAAGLVVLLAAVHSDYRQRLGDAALLRALGAGRRRVMLYFACEFGFLGVLAGLLAALFAMVAAWLLATRVFEVPFVPGPGLPLAAMAGGAAVTLAAGLAVARKAANLPPLQAFRQR